MVSAKTVTILFTDLVGSTELLQRAGDEQAQRIFKAHHRLLSEAVRSHGGHEVKWLGDGLMVAFDSAANAVRCAIAMQQASRRPAAGERLEIRAGLNVGEAFVNEADYFGTSVVIARRLCDSSGAGEIRASDIVVRPLDGRGGDINTNDLGPLELKGITNAVPAVEIVYQHDPMALLRKLPFVGRQAEYEAMLKKLAEASNGRGSVVLLAGEPGIGKTRLTEEFCEHASSGATVIRGNCYEGDVAAPFGPWTEALRSLIDQTPDAEVRETLGPGAPDIAPIIPEIRRRIPDLEESPKLDPESERARLFESIAAWLRNAANTKPLVIFLDDLHWCDRPSLALLEQVARGVADKRIVIVGTYRDVEVDRVHPLAQTLASLRRMEHHERIAVRGFTQESVYDLLSAIELSEQAEAAKRGLAQVLFTESEGNPFFLREVLNNLVETGKLAQQDGVWTGTVASIEELGIPEGIKEVVGRRLSCMSETCNRMLGRASAMTGGFTWDELRSISDDPEDALLDALDEALGAQLLEERQRNTYAFTHALIRATLYDELSTPRRVQLHRRIAEALEALYAGNREPHLAELAYHLCLSMPTAEDALKAIDYARRAGDYALRATAYEESVDQYQRALQLLDALPEPGHEQRAGLLVALGTARFYAGDMAGSIDAFVAAAEHALLAEHRELLVCALTRNGILWPATDPQLLSLGEEALRRLPSEDHPQRARLLVQVAVHLNVAEPLEVNRLRAAQLGREAESMARHLEDPEVLAHVLFWLQFVLLGPETSEERLSMASELLRIGQTTGDLWTQRAGHMWRFLTMLELGDPAMDADLERYVRSTEEIGAPQQRWLARMYQAMRAVFRGEADAEALAQRALAIGANTHEGYGMGAAPTFGVQLFALRRDQGRLAELAEAFTSQLRERPDLLGISGRCALALLYAELGRQVEARREFEDLAQDDFAIVRRDINPYAALPLLPDVCAFLHDVERAKVLYRLVQPFDRRVVVVGWRVAIGSGARLLGLLASMMSRRDGAERHFEDALVMEARMSARPSLARTRLNYGDMLLKRAESDATKPDDRERAVALLNEALAFAKESGMGKVERDAERLLAGV